MLIEKEYYRLEEVAKEYGCPLEMLIHLGATSAVPIYVIPRGWYVDIWGCENNDDAPADNTSVGTPWKTDTATVRITDPVRLYADTLMRFELDQSATEFKFAAPYDEYTPDFDYEYRLADGPDGKSTKEIAIANYSLVIRAADVSTLKKLFPKAEDKSLGEKEKSTLLKLVIGMAMGGYCYDPKEAKSEKPNEICKDIHKLGLEINADTVRKWLKQGAALLEPKPDKD